MFHNAISQTKWISDLTSNVIIDSATAININFLCKQPFHSGLVEITQIVNSKLTISELNGQI